MSRILIVRAHPLTSEASRSMQLADAFVRAYVRLHPDHDVSDLNLYSVAIPEIDLDLLSGWRKLSAGVPFVHLDQPEQNKVTLFSNYTDQFLAADKVVIANPLWNLGVPTRLKAWVDTICVAGKTFRYNAAGDAVGLVTGKKALHIQASGGVFGGQDPASVYLKTMFNFLGVTDFVQVTAEGMDHDPTHADEIMARAFARIEQAAKEF
ncbi:FMN-dependent NADH-azoreductase [Rarobacter incanus]|uniref:FMN dependent NADH:quinone oxidoreductase n=1 Tax=Rarobacter incanus TaxID=153494 RepID=A0A542SQX6_9MICO|nr:FMN-dependent NADH-azoreductase [Rarobacter incanus]TQK77026.1 FMN-dependent NADH-azoreductase [Rarobacter incanus]